MATKQSIQDKQDETFKCVVGGIVSLWFASAIKDHASCEKNFELKPHAALCLAVMVNKSVASSRSIAAQLGRFGLGLFEMVESSIVCEYGMLALQDAGFVRLDTTGKKEYLLAQDARNYGLEGVHWTLTAAGAKRAAPFYCAQIGKPSTHQKQAIADILAANKAAIQNGRGLNVVEKKKVPTVAVKKSKAREVAEKKSA